MSAAKNLGGDSLLHCSYTKRSKRIAIVVKDHVSTSDKPLELFFDVLQGATLPVDAEVFAQVFAHISDIDDEEVFCFFVQGNQRLPNIAGVAHVFSVVSRSTGIAKQELYSTRKKFICKYITILLYFITWK